VSLYQPSRLTPNAHPIAPQQHSAELGFAGIALRGHRRVAAKIA